MKKQLLKKRDNPECKERAKFKIDKRLRKNKKSVNELQKENLTQLNKTGTNHKIIFGDSREMSRVVDKSVHLVVTSPPYPMIEMWDRPFIKMNTVIKQLFSDFEKAESDPEKEEIIDNIYGQMHESLSSVWQECHRVLIDGGILCINIGDATRKMNGLFRLFPNHARIIETCEKIGFVSLPYIIWKKPTNKPNAFLGSGFMPPNAYVTLEAEYILIFRKGDLRRFDRNDPKRVQSIITREQRDAWFTQVWGDVRGVKQTNELIERRTGAFPDEIARRLISMFSIKGDTVLDPFAGTATTTINALDLDRNSISYEIDKSLKKVILAKIGLRKYDGQIAFWN